MTRTGRTAAPWTSSLSIGGESSAVLGFPCQKLARTERPLLPWIWDQLTHTDGTTRTSITLRRRHDAGGAAIGNGEVTLTQT